jgi:hypothetical protein
MMEEEKGGQWLPLAVYTLPHIHGQILEEVMNLPL